MSGGAQRLAIGVRDGSVCALVADAAELDAAERIDAAVLVVLPGVVEPHCHFWDPGPTEREDWETGTRAAAAGGVTTVIEMPLADPPTVDAAAFELKQARAAACACVDYALWGGIVPASMASLGQRLDELRERGAVGFKAFMAGRRATIRRSTTACCCGRWRRSPVATACSACTRRTTRSSSSARQPRTPPARPARRLRRVATRDRRGRGGAAGDPARRGDRRPDLRRSPHMRNAHRRSAPARMSSGFGSTSSTARSTPSARTTRRSRASRRIPGRTTSGSPRTGVPGIQTMLPLLWSEGVARRGLAPERLADLLAGNVARTFGLPARKGRVAVGADADLALVDPDATWTVDDESLEYKNRWSPNRGLELQGRVVRTILRGRTVYADGNVTGERGLGRQVFPA